VRATRSGPTIRSTRSRCGGRAQQGGPATILYRTFNWHLRSSSACGASCALASPDGTTS
jgi:hypothetical protein